MNFDWLNMDDPLAEWAFEHWLAGNATEISLMGWDETHVMRSPEHLRPCAYAVLLVSKNGLCSAAALDGSEYSYLLRNYAEVA